MLACAALIALSLIVLRCRRQWLRRAQPTTAWWLGWLPPLGLLVAVGWAVAIDLETQKLVSNLIMPAGLLWVGLIGLVAGLWRVQRRGALLAAMILTGWTVGGNVWCAGWLMQRLQAPIPSDDPLQRPPYDAVLVLGGGTSIDQAGHPAFGASGDRVAVAARLWLAGRTPILVASGSAMPELSQPRDLAAETMTLWHGLGIPSSAMIAAPGPRTTSEEMRVYARLIAQHGWQRVGLVTSAWHLPRALRLAQRQGLTLDPIAADWKGTGRDTWSAANLVPRESALLDSRLAIWELVGAAAGR
jgi:uncharacterized SAM-binding protein YcdF (DUF218 family)